MQNNKISEEPAKLCFAITHMQVQHNLIECRLNNATIWINRNAYERFLIETNRVESINGASTGLTAYYDFIAAHQQLFVRDIASYLKLL